MLITDHAVPDAPALQVYIAFNTGLAASEDDEEVIVLVTLGLMALRSQCDTTVVAEIRYKYFSNVVEELQWITVVKESAFSSLRK